MLNHFSKLLVSSRLCREIIHWTVRPFTPNATQLLKPDVLKAMLQSSAEQSLVVGDVHELPEGFFRGLGHAKSGKPRYPYAVALAEIGHARMEKGEFPAPDDIRPMYLREPDVTINWTKLRSEGPWGSV